MPRAITRPAGTQRAAPGLRPQSAGRQRGLGGRAGRAPCRRRCPARRRADPARRGSAGRRRDSRRRPASPRPGVMTRFWSSRSAAAGRMPGVTIRKPRPAGAADARDLERRRDDAVHARLAARAAPAARPGAPTVAGDADAPQVARAARLVSTVTARMRRPAQALAPADARHLGARRASIISRLPEACRSKKRTPSRAASTPALRDRVRDVVELEIEEDVARRGGGSCARPRARRARRAACPTLKKPTSAREQRGRARSRLAERVDVEREDQPVPDAVGGATAHARASPRPHHARRPAPPTSATGTSVASRARRALHLDAAARERARPDRDAHRAGRSDRRP